jgi:hypothetical protein
MMKLALGVAMALTVLTGEAGARGSRVPAISLITGTVRPRLTNRGRLTRLASQSRQSEP